MLVGGVELTGNLNDSPLAERVWKLAPWETHGETWGEEVYFPVRLEAENTDPKETLAVGDIAYWPEGPDLCLFFGRTPKSTGDEPVVPSPATVIGSFEVQHADLRMMQRERKGIPVRIERFVEEKPAEPARPETDTPEPEPAEAPAQAETPAQAEAPAPAEEPGPAEPPDAETPGDEATTGQ